MSPDMSMTRTVHPDDPGAHCDSRQGHPSPPADTEQYPAKPVACHLSDAIAGTDTSSSDESGR